MALRSPKERIFQTFCLEVGGILIGLPAYMLIFGSSVEEGAAVLIAVSLAVMIWLPLFNAAFDWADLRLTGRLASNRPHRIRLLHSVLHEASTVLITLPLIMWMSALRFWQALALDLGLSLFYLVYAYVFYVIYDRLRPVRPDPS